MHDGSPEDPQLPDADDSAHVIRPIKRRGSASAGDGGEVSAAAAEAPVPRRPRGASTGSRGKRPAAKRPAAKRAGARPAAISAGLQRLLGGSSGGRGIAIFRGVLIVATLLAFIGSGVIGYAYQTTYVPRPEDVKISQVSTVYYNGGEELARIGSQNRTIVSLDRVPKHVQHAVLAAENRSFYSDPGFSPTGIGRAIWTNFTTGATQGGSTITQQYVKKAYLSDERTFARKFKELIISVKLEKEYTKDQILGFYLNTIYFGRGAYGIEAASEVYFGKPVEQLTPAEGAVLASSIRSPAGYDPQNHPAEAKARWDYVLNGMVKGGWMSEAERKAAQYPQVLPIGTATLNQASGPEGVILTRLKEELAGLGYDEDRINSEGLKITTTIPKNFQDDAVKAVQDQLAGQPSNLVPGLVSVDPSTGAIRAYYGNSQGSGFDFAGRAYRQPGSSFKPFVLAAALENGYSVYTTRDGSSPQTFPDRPQPVRNSGGLSCGSCTLKDAITQSLNTTFYGLSYEMGPAKVADAAHRAGIAAKRADNGAPTLQEQNGQVASAIGIGLYEVTVRDMASAFATFAADGVYRAPYMVEKITDSAGNLLYEHKNEDKRVFSHEVANDVSFALSDVAAYSKDSLADGRPSAAKTGTVQLGDENNKDAWMAGYTPQLSTAVWIGTQGSDAILTKDGRIIYGSGIPGKIWKQYMDSALDGAQIMDMPDTALIKGGKSNGKTSTSKKKTTTTKKATTHAPAPTTQAPPPTTTSDTPPPPTTTQAPPPTTTQPPPPAPTTTTSQPQPQPQPPGLPGSGALPLPTG